MERHPAGLERFLADFARARDILSTFPMVGRERPEIGEALRSHIVHPFIVCYRVDYQRQCVAVVRILHGHLDFEAAEL